MPWIATAMLLAAAPQAEAPAAEQQAAPKRQARAIVRILRPATIRLGEEGGTRAEGAVVRRTELRTRDGSAERLAVVEFY